jgi:hypothetical protein
LEALACDRILGAVAHDPPAGAETGETLKRVLASVQVRKYTFTREVRLEPRLVNGAFPVLTLNVCLADPPDELLSSPPHEGLHGWLVDHPLKMQDAVRQWREISLHAPVRRPESAETKYSTYGHLVDATGNSRLAEDRRKAIGLRIPRSAREGNTTEERNSPTGNAEWESAGWQATSGMTIRDGANNPGIMTD